MMVYKWKTTGFKIDAQTAGEELERISQKCELTAANVVKESEDENAVLHSLFEWDDEKAGVKYREHQARVITGNLIPVRINGKEVKEPIRAFVKIQDAYQPLDIVLKIDDYKDEMLKRALNELRSFQKKYSALAELTNVFKQIQIILEDAE